MESAAPRYLVLGIRASGATCDVLEAVEERTSGSRPVIMKRLRDAQDPTAIRSFFDECRVVGQLDHPGIVRLLDVGVESGRPFQILELVDGMDTRSVIDAARELASPIPRDVAFHITAKIARALDYAHHLPGLELVHRDVTPENILIARDGTVRLTDFGIAVFAERATSTLVGMTKGKLAYMSPEQVLASHLDLRADIFSAGCVLHALLTGASPLEDEANQDRLLLGEALALSATLDSAAKSIIEKALASDRRGRFQEAHELAAACEAQVESSDPRALVASLVEELSSDDVKTMVVETPEQGLTLVLAPTEADGRSFEGRTASGATLSEYLTFLSSRDFGAEVHTQTQPRAFDLEETTEPRTGTEGSKTAPNPLWFTPTATPIQVPSSQEPRLGRPKAMVWASTAAAVVALGLIAVLAVRINEKTQDRSRIAPAAEEPTGALPITAVPVRPAPPPEIDPPEIASPDESVEPKSAELSPKRTRRRVTRKTPEVAETPPEAEPRVDEAAVSRSLKRLVAEIKDAQNKLPPKTLARLEGAYLELGTAANRATTLEERAAIVDRARALSSELRRAAASPEPTD